MNNQEIFDKVSAHLLTQKRKAFDGSAQICRYRTSNEMSCAVGCLIPKELYDDKIEGTSIGSLIDYPSYSNALSGESILLRILEQLEIESDESLEFLNRLQNIHDYTNAKKWSDSLVNLAISFNLDPSIVLAYSMKVQND